MVWIFSCIWSVAGLCYWSRVDGVGVSVKHFTKYVAHDCVNENQLFYLASFLGIYLFPLIVMTCFYLRIMRVALKQSRVISSTRVSPLSTPNETRRMRTWSLIRELKATKSVAIVYVAFVVCFLPGLIITIIVYIDSDYFSPLRLHDPMTFKFINYTFFEILPQINSGLNPFIYSFANKQFRNAFKKVWYSLLKKCGLQSDLRSGSASPTRSYNSNNVSPISRKTRSSRISETMMRDLSRALRTSPGYFET